METLEEKRDLKYSLMVLVVYITIFINSYVFFTDPFEFYIGYLVYILMLPGLISRHSMHPRLIAIFLILFLTGLANVFIGNDTAALFFKVFTGLFLSYVFYYYIIVDFNFNIEQLFKWYLKGAYIAALLGIFQFLSFQLGFQPGYTFFGIFNKWGFIPGGNFGIRVNSVFSEPTNLAAVLSAAFFVSLYNLTRREPFYLSKFKSLVIIIVYILSFSGLGQSGILISLLFLAISFGLFRYIIIFIPLGIMVFNLLYNNSLDFKDRLDSLVELYSTGKFVLGKTHGSSFILYNNFHIAIENFKSNFLFGSGIGSHPIAFEKYSLAASFKVYGFNLNSADANSMGVRIISEAGLFGASIFLFIIFKGYIRRDENNLTYHWLVSNAILIMILLNLFRQGHYFLYGFPFFVFLYIYNSISYKQYLETGKDLYQSQIEVDNPTPITT